MEKQCNLKLDEKLYVKAVEKSKKLFGVRNFRGYVRSLIIKDLKNDK